MKLHHSITASSGILLLALYAQTLPAEQFMYNTPPSAEEMGKVLFGDRTSGTPVTMKTRSINFQPKRNERADDSAFSENAETEKNSIGLPIEFAYNSEEILSKSLSFLEEVGKMMTMLDYADKQLIIEGHTDAVGSASYNLDLSRRRAQAVRNYLALNFGVSSNRLITKGLGKSKPLPGRNPFDAANRRVHFYSAN